MEYNDNKKFILNYKMINQDLVHEVIILDDDDFIQTTFSLFATNELSEQKEQTNNVSPSENLMEPSCDFIDLTSNDDFDLYDMFMLNPDSNYNLTSQMNENVNLKKEIILSVKPELESKKMTSFEEIPQVTLKDGEISTPEYMSPPDNSIENTTVKNKKFTCPECLKSFKKSYNYKRHLLLHQIKNNESSSFELEANHCPNCTKEIADRSNFIKHLKICCPQSLENFRYKKKKKLTSLNEFSCPICEKIFSKKYNLNRHLGVHFLNELNRNNELSINVDERSMCDSVTIHLYQCENCLRRFSSKQLLNNHKVKWHGTKYSCKYCKDLIFNEKLELIRHLNLNHRIKYKFECKFCKKSFPYVSQFIQHRLTHINKVEINQWDKITKLSDAITDGSDCSLNSLKNAQCLYCGKSVSKNFNLKRHLQTKHSVETDDQINKKFSQKQNNFFEQNKSNFLLNKI